MKRLFFTLFPHCLLLGLAVRDVSANKSPCHQYKSRYQYGCEKIIMPDGFCAACGIGAYTANGNYVDCTRTTILESSPLCLDRFQAYVDLNPCDVKRRQALLNYQSADPVMKERGRQVLDYFHYSQCEAACDCIPQLGANPHNCSMDATRGNCQGHLWYDTCKVFPDYKVMQLNGTAYINETALPPVCPFIDAWFLTPDGQNFENVPHTNVDPNVVKFLETAWIAQQVPQSSYWLECYNHEVTQSRIEAYVEPQFQTIRINAGNLTLDYTDTQGKVWSTDRYFVSGANNIFSKYLEIALTKDDELYQTERNSEGSLQYEIPAPAGKYNVTLGFSEIYFAGVGMRIFDVSVEGNLIYDDLDLILAAGRKRAPFTVSTTVDVSDGFVSISLDPVKDKPKISWILVELA